MGAPQTLRSGRVIRKGPAAAFCTQFEPYRILAARSNINTCSTSLQSGRRACGPAAAPSSSGEASQLHAQGPERVLCVRFDTASFVPVGYRRKVGWREDLERHDPASRRGSAPQPACPDCGAQRTVHTIDRALYCPNCDHTWNVDRTCRQNAAYRAYACVPTPPPKLGPACSLCQSPRTEAMVALSAINPDFYFFSCQTCGHMWIVNKTPPTTA